MEYRHLEVMIGQIRSTHFHAFDLHLFKLDLDIINMHLNTENKVPISSDLNATA